MDLVTYLLTSKCACWFKPRCMLTAFLHVLFQLQSALCFVNLCVVCIFPWLLWYCLSTVDCLWKLISEITCVSCVECDAKLCPSLAADNSKEALITWSHCLISAGHDYHHVVAAFEHFHSVGTAVVFLLHSHTSDRHSNDNTNTLMCQIDIRYQLQI